MSQGCNITKAIEALLSFPASAKRVQRVIDNDKLIKEEYSNLVFDEFKTTPDKVSLTQFARGLRNIIRDVVKPTVKRDKDFVLDQVVFGMQGIAGGKYSAPSKAVTLVRNIPKDAIKAKLEKSLYEQFLTITGNEKDATTYFNNNKGEVEPEVDRVFKLIADAKGPNLLMHEMLHAGTVEHMFNYPDSPSTTRIEDLYNYLATNHNELGIKEGYWKTSKEEFVAEALTNTELISAMLKITPDKQVGKLATAYDAFISGILDMFGFSPKDKQTLFDILLDSTLSMLPEERVSKPKKPSLAEDLEFPEITNEEQDFTDFGEDIIKDTNEQNNKEQEPAQETAEPSREQKQADATEGVTDETTSEAIKRLIESNEEYAALEAELVAIQAAIASDTRVIESANSRIKDKGGANRLLKLVTQLDKNEEELVHITEAITQTSEAIEELRDNASDSTKLYLKDLQKDLASFISSQDKLSKGIAKDKSLKKVIKTNLTKRTNARESKEENLDTSDAIKSELKAKKIELSSVATGLLANKPKMRANTKNTSLGRFFSPKAVTNAFTVLGDAIKDGFAKAVDLLPLSNIDKTHLSDAKRLMTDTENNIKKTVDETIHGGAIPARSVDFVKGAEGYQNVVALLMQDVIGPNGFPISGKRELPPVVVTALAASMNDWMLNAGSNRAKTRTDDEINKFIGSPQGTPITPKIRAQISDVDALGNDTADNIGKAVIRAVGIDSDTNKFKVSEVLLGKLATEIGLIGMQTMSDAGLATIKTKKVSEIFGDNADITEGDNSINVIEFTEQGNNLIDNNLSPGTIATNDILGIESRRKGPRFNKNKSTKEFITKGFGGKYTTIAGETQKALNHVENVEWTLNDDFIADITDMLESESGTNTLRDFLGYKDPAKHHIRDLEGIEGKNRAIELNIKHLQDMVATMDAKEDKGMYFNYFFSKNGRFFIESNTFNPQTSKLHRFSVGTGEVEVKTEADLNVLDQVMGQAFGVDTDKMTSKSALKEWSGIEAKLLKAGLHEMSMADAVEVLQELKIRGHDPEHIMAGVTEFRRYAEHKVANNSMVGFKSKLPLEIDAVTSGYILKTLQMPLIADVEGHLEGGGVFVADKDGNFKYNSFGEQAEDVSTLDAYQKPAKVMLEKARDIAKAAGKGSPLLLAAELASDTDFSTLKDDGSVTKEMRAFMKNPFMVFNYGSGMSSIISAMVDSSEDKFYQLLVKEDENSRDKLSALILSSATGMEEDKGKWTKAKTELKALSESEEDRFRSSSPTELLSFTLDPRLMGNLKSNVEASLGVALSETFNETYKVYINAGKDINTAFRTMFRLFNTKLKGITEERESKLGRHLNEAEVEEIISSISESMPAIKTALATTDTDRLVIIDEKNGLYKAIPGEKQVITGQGKLFYSENKFLSGQARRKELAEAYAAGSVIPIHYIDGALMSKTLGTTDSLGVHDALMTLIDAAVKDGKTYNQAMAEVAASYSLTNEILSSLQQSINAATDEEIKAVNDEYVVDHKGDPENVPTVGRSLGAMTSLHADAENARAELFSNAIRYEHMAMEGSHFDWNTEQKPYVKQEPEHTIQVERDLNAVTPKKVVEKAPVSVATKSGKFILPVDKLGKDQEKATWANGFIGEGLVGTSTNRYLSAAVDAKLPTNNAQSLHNSDSKVFVSVNGGGKLTKKVADRYIQNIAGVLGNGGTIIMDNDFDAARSYNKSGEGVIQDRVMKELNGVKTVITLNGKEYNTFSVPSTREPLGSSYLSAVDIQAKSAIIPTNIEVNGVPSSAIAREVAKTENKIKKCKA